MNEVWQAEGDEHFPPTNCVRAKERASPSSDLRAGEADIHFTTSERAPLPIQNANNLFLLPIHGEYHDSGAFPPPPLNTTGLMRSGKTGGPGRWIRHEDWRVMWDKAKDLFPDRFPL